MYQIIAIDVGSTGLKECIFDEKGTLIASAYEEYPTLYSNDMWVEQDPNDWWRSFCSTTARLIEHPVVDKKKIVCMVSSGQMSTAIPVDSKGNVLIRPVFIWADMRTTKEVHEINEALGEGEFYRITGAGMIPETYSISKILWIKNNLREIYDNTYKFLQVKDYITLKLTGNFITDFSDASDTGMVEAYGSNWSDKICKAVRLDTNKLPTILESTNVAGTVTKEAAVECHLPEGLPVIAGAGDVCCATAGAGVFDEGKAYIYVGSATWVGVFSRTPRIIEDSKVVNFRFIRPDSYALHYIMYGGAICLRWFKDTFGDLENIAATVTETNVYELLDKLAQKSNLGANGLFFVPYIRGSGAPYNDPNAKGVFIGFDAGSKKEDFIRSILESVGYSLKQLLLLLETHDVRVDETAIIGGGAKSSLWREIIADILNKKIHRTRNAQEANARGAAILGALGMKMYNTEEDLVKKWFKEKEVDEPDFERNGMYERRFKIFDNLYDLVKPIYRQIDDLQK